MRQTAPVQRLRRVTLTISVDERDPLDRYLVEMLDRVPRGRRRAEWAKRQVLLSCLLAIFFDNAAPDRLLKLAQLRLFPVRPGRNGDE